MWFHELALCKKCYLIPESLWGNWWSSWYCSWVSLRDQALGGLWTQWDKKCVYSCLGQDCTVKSGILRQISVKGELLCNQFITQFSSKPAEKEEHSAWNGSDRSCFISLLEKGPVGNYIVRYPCNSHFNINKGSVQVHFLAQPCQLEKDPPTHCFCILLFCSVFTYAICDVCISWWPFQQFVVLILLAVWERWNSPRKATWTYGKVQFCSM